jgi:hypothetical protein
VTQLDLYDADDGTIEAETIWQRLGEYMLGADWPEDDDENA